jgi:hypothetical protein
MILTYFNTDCSGVFPNGWKYRVTAQKSGSRLTIIDEQELQERAKYRNNDYEIIPMSLPLYKMNGKKIRFMGILMGLAEHGNAPFKLDLGSELNTPEIYLQGGCIKVNVPDRRMDIFRRKVGLQTSLQTAEYKELVRRGTREQRLALKQIVRRAMDESSYLSKAIER